jgi:imidazoleglycerol phosphate dehydratase HisB
MEAVFKGLAKAIEMAVERKDEKLPSTKGVLD